MRLLILGPPGAGKGTQSDKIVEHYNVKHISTGDMFRENIKGGTELGKKATEYMDKGLLVPDSLVNDMVMDRLSKDDLKENGFLLDGYPRNISQAEALKDMLTMLDMPLDAVINIEVPSKFLIDRITGRRVCPKCQRSYHIANNPPKEEGICDYDGEALITRKDDNEETVKNRIDVYDKETKPLVDFYTAEGIILNIDGTLSIDETFESIKSKLGR